MQELLQRLIQPDWTRRQINELLHSLQEDWQWSVSSHVDRHPSVHLSAYGAELETLRLCMGRAHSIPEAEPFMQPWTGLTQINTVERLWVFFFFQVIEAYLSFKSECITMTHFARWHLIIQRKGQKLQYCYFFIEHYFLLGELAGVNSPMNDLVYDMQKETFQPV